MRSASLPLYLSSLMFAVMALCGKALSPPHLAALSLAWIVLLRSTVAFGVLAVPMALEARGGLAPMAAHWKGMVVRGVAGCLSMWTYFEAIQCVPVGEAVLVSNTSPIWTALFSSIFLKETMPRRLWLAFPLTFLGVLLVSWPSLRQDGGSQMLGIASGLASAIFAGAAYSTVRSLRGVPASWVACSLLTAGTLTALPACMSRPLPHFGATAATIAVTMGLTGGLAQWLMTIGYQRNKATRASTINMTTVGFTLLLAWPALGERPQALQIVGLVLIFAGCGFATAATPEVEPIAAGET